MRRHNAHFTALHVAQEARRAGQARAADRAYATEGAPRFQSAAAISTPAAPPSPAAPPAAARPGTLQPTKADTPAYLTSPSNGRRAASSGPLYALVHLCRTAGINEPVPEYQFHPTRRWRFDYAWPLTKLALEVEGGIWTNGRHTRGAGALADLEKYSEAAIAGWRVIYCTPSDLATTGLERVRRALA